MSQILEWTTGKFAIFLLHIRSAVFLVNSNKVSATRYFKNVCWFFLLSKTWRSEKFTKIWHFKNLDKIYVQNGLILIPRETVTPTQHKCWIRQGFKKCFIIIRYRPTLKGMINSKVQLLEISTARAFFCFRKLVQKWTNAFKVREFLLE